MMAEATVQFDTSAKRLNELCRVWVNERRPWLDGDVEVKFEGNIILPARPQPTCPMIRTLDAWLRWRIERTKL